MKKMPKFDPKVPENNEEKLIVEIKKDLMNTIKATIRLNETLILSKCSINPENFFSILRDGTLAFTYDMLNFLNLQIKEGHQDFLTECEDILKCYMAEIRKNNNVKNRS